MPFDHYDEATKLAEELRKNNFFNYANAIIDAMECGATGTEIFMALRWNIEKVIKSCEVSDSLKTQAKRLYKELDKSLK